MNKDTTEGINGSLPLLCGARNPAELRFPGVRCGGLANAL